MEVRPRYRGREKKKPVGPACILRGSENAGRLIENLPTCFECLGKGPVIFRIFSGDWPRVRFRLGPTPPVAGPRKKLERICRTRRRQATHLDDGSLPARQNSRLENYCRLGWNSSVRTSARKKSLGSKRQIVVRAWHRGAICEAGRPVILARKNRQS